MDAVTAYEQARMRLDMVESEKQMARTAIMAKVQPELEALDAEFADKLAQVSGDLANAETQVKAAVLIAGQSVKGDHVTVVYAKGREKMNVEAVKGFLRAHKADLSAFMETGEPSVSIRWTR